MGIKAKRPAIWISYYDKEKYPQFIKALDEWYESDNELDFSHYWNRHVKYPFCRFYYSKDQWRLYFDNEQDLTAWLLGLNLNQN